MSRPCQRPHPCCEERGAQMQEIRRLRTLLAELGEALRASPFGHLNELAQRIDAELGPEATGEPDEAPPNKPGGGGEHAG